jgi:hypothetical protein
MLDTFANGQTLVVTSNNFPGNGGAFGNCGILSNGTIVTASSNYWGSATGPGAVPADDVCGVLAVTTPFLRAPVLISPSAGR